MSTPAWVIPVASLAGICAIGLLFFFWWFPRTWQKGTRQELEILAAQKAQRERAAAMMQKDVETGEFDEDDGVEGAPARPQKAFVYSPPAVTPYG